MSQIEQDFRQYISKRPEIKLCYLEGLINRRSLARHIIKEGIGKANQIEAIIAMLRRFDFGKSKRDKENYFSDVKVNIKDKILILDFEKEKELLKKLQKVIAHTNYDKGDTLKIVVGTAAIKVFIDKENEGKLGELLKEFKLKKRYDKLSEISLMFSEKATGAKGIVSILSTELHLNDIPVNEILTGAPELLIYLKDDYVLKAYEIIKRLQK